MYTMKDALERNIKLMDALDSTRAECLRLQVDAKRFADLNDSLIEDNEAFQEEIKRLKAELVDERDRFDKLSDFELAQAEELREAKLYIHIILEYLTESGYNTDKLEKIVALKRVLKKLEEENE